MDREELLKYYRANEAAAEEMLRKLGVQDIDANLIWELLQVELGQTDVPTDVLFHQLDSGEILEIMSKFVIDEIGRPAIIELERDAQRRDVDELIKADIKVKGERWVIHKGDADPFPSKPHAHLIGTNRKLHLGNGGIYIKSSCVQTMPKKKLLLIRETFNAKFPQIKLPRLLV